MTGQYLEQIEMFHNDVKEFANIVEKNGNLLSRATSMYYPTRVEMGPNSQKTFFEFDSKKILTLLDLILKATHLTIKKCDHCKELLYQEEGQAYTKLDKDITFQKANFLRLVKLTERIQQNCFSEDTSKFIMEKKDRFDRYLRELRIIMPRCEQLKVSLIRHIIELERDS